MNSGISPISYTNKDFQSIYPELIEVVKKLSSKWDPSISNESDPGVILLKLNAIIADKNNYNIDKNILEAFPETVTQPVNARNLFKQLGYSMPWYQSAHTTVKIQYTGSTPLEDNQSITIPQYTMVCDANSQFIYTLLGNVKLTKRNPIVTVEAAEGVYTDFILNGEAVITIEAFDSQNRLYLGDLSVAQNHIIIRNAVSGAVWDPVNNLATTQLGTRAYEFGVDGHNQQPYIELPEDAVDLMGDGITVSYLISSGAHGNISEGTLIKLYEDIPVFKETLGVSEKEQVNITDLMISNTSSALGGRDPESVSDAYKGYKKTVGTFTTLVTLRDYLNHLMQMDEISNGFVTDRTNDLQSTYNVKTYGQEATRNYTYVSKVEVPISDAYMKDEEGIKTPLGTQVYTSEPEMTAFDLKLYLLPKVPDSPNVSEYNASFELMANEAAIFTANESLATIKSIQHDFLDILPNVPCMFKNVYAYRVKYIPTKYLDSAAQEEVTRNINAAIYRNFNSSKVEFGVAPEYNELYSTILNADTRIKTLILSDPRYVTYAVYLKAPTKEDEDPVFVEFPISDTTFEDELVYNCADKAHALAIVERNSTDSFINHTYFIIQQPDPKPTLVCKVKSTSKLKDSEATLEERFEATFEELTTEYDNIRTDIVAKSVLCGVTPLFQYPSDIMQNILEEEIEAGAEISKLGTACIIAPFANTTGNDSATTEKLPWGSTSDIGTYSDKNTVDSGAVSYKLNKNESVRFFTPQFTDGNTYANYVKYFLYSENDQDHTKFIARKSSDEYTGTHYITAADYDKVSLYDWEYLSENVQIVRDNDSDPYLHIPRTEQAVINLYDQLPSVYNAPTRYTITVEGRVHSDNSDPSNSSVNWDDCVLWQFNSTTCDGTKSEEDKRFTDLEYDHDKAGVSTFEATWDKPANTKSFSLRFHFEDADVDIISVAVKKWNTVGVSPTFEVPCAQTPYNKPSDPEQAAKLTDPELSIALTNENIDAYICTSSEDDTAGDASPGLFYDGYYTLEGSSLNTGRMYSLLYAEPTYWNIDCTNYWEPIRSSFEYKPVNEWTPQYRKNVFYFTPGLPGEGEPLNEDTFEDNNIVQEFAAAEAQKGEHNYTYYTNFSNYFTDDGLKDKLGITGGGMIGENTRKAYEALPLYTEGLYFKKDSSGNYKKYEWTNLTNWENAKNETDENSKPVLYYVSSATFQRVSRIWDYEEPSADSNIANNGDFKGYKGSFMWKKDDDFPQYYSAYITSYNRAIHPEAALMKQGDIVLYEKTQYHAIPSDVLYQLKDNEYLLTFSKESDSDHAPYVCHSYKKGDVFQANFPLEFRIKGNDVSDDDFFSSLIIRSSDTDEPYIPTTVPTTSPSFSYIATSILTDTVGTDKIVIKKPVYISSQSSQKEAYIKKCWFITTTTVETADPSSSGSKKQYKLTLTRTTEGEQDTTEDEQDVVSYQYTLQNNEVLMYIDDVGGAGTLGAGTLIEVIPPTASSEDKLEYHASVYTLDEMVSLDSTKAQQAFDSCTLTTALANGKSSVTLNCYAQDTITLVEGDTIHFENIPTTPNLNRELESDPELLLKSCAVLFDAGDYSNRDSVILRIYSYGTTLFNDSDYKIHAVCAGTDTTIPVISSNTLSTSARSYYNIQSAPTSPQTIYKETKQSSGEIGASYTFLKINDYSTATESELSATKLYTSTELPLVGGTNIALGLAEWSDVAIEYRLTKAYTEDNNNTYPQVTLSDNSIVTVKLPTTTASDDNTVTIETSTLWKSDVSHIMAITAIDGDLDKLTVELSFDDKTTKEIFPLSTDDDRSNSRIYVIMPRPDDFMPDPDNPDSTILRKNCDGIIFTVAEGNTLTFQITDFAAVTKTAFESKVSWDDVYRRVEALDYEKKFDYLVKVDSNDEILNPLQASSFFDINHPFNKFTIPQINTFMDVRASRISIANNRG